ncbi:CLUMA_CG017529, isoform A [Clunio marinus]|uniref:CLUMA_CG017529, isoform A n=1 Tax=Clunio marinus TaxID=568069 RepID=A0A1J1IY02_9DIPT|nr:CLUMA_CG017529, isoform A [Clunio marinus]
MSVYYKFNSELNFSYVGFDGLHISVSDLKKAILHQKRLGKTADFDLLISNAQTKEEYKDEQCLIPKNTSLIVARIPISNQHKKSWEVAQNTTERLPQNPSTENINHDITRMNGSEEDKIQAMMMQSTLDYDPTNYQRVRGTNQTGEVPPNYRCHKCHKPGHWIKNCPLNPVGSKDHHHFKTRPESKKMTGIPRSLRDNIGAEQEPPPQNMFIEEKREIPEDLVCAICKGIFKDAVMIPCCGSSFCDECVRTALLESEDNECPDCKEKGTSPGSLIPNRFLRNAVAAFYSETSNILSRESQKKETEEVKEEIKATHEPEKNAENQETEVQDEDEPMKNFDEKLETIEKKDEQLTEVESGNVGRKETTEKDSESDDDDNITVTVPPAHHTSWGASYRDNRPRRISSHGANDFHDSYMSNKNSQDDNESYEDETSDSYSRQHQKRSNHYEHSSSNTPQGISTLVGDDNSNNQSLYHSSGPSHITGQNIQQQNDGHYQSQAHSQPPSMYNQNQQHGMMSQMPSHQMYPQGPSYGHQPSGPYYPGNQARPMRFDHQGNYQVPMRHHHHHMQSQMMRPMHDNYSMRHPRPQMNNLANAVTHNIQQRFGTGFIDDPLEAFNRIMREKEMRKDRYRRSPIRSGDRRSRSFERKRSPVHQYSPENRRQKNYVKPRKRSRSFKSNSSKSRSFSPRGRSKSRSYSPRYRRKENAPKDRRDEKHRSPVRRTNRGSRNNYKGDNISSTNRQHATMRDVQEHNLENLNNKHEPQNFDYNKETNNFEGSHSLEEQPPPPGDESELCNLQQLQEMTENVNVDNRNITENVESVMKDSSETNGSSKVENITKKIADDNKAEHSDHRHHHHKKNRSRNYDSSDEKKSRDKKKRKKSKEHEKKKSKKDRKDKEKKSTTASSKNDSIEKTPEIPAEPMEVAKEIEDNIAEKLNEVESSTPALDCSNENELPPEAAATINSRTLIDNQRLNRSDSVLDINPNIDLEIDEWIAPEVSKWEREENKSTTTVEHNEVDVGVGEVKKNYEEKVTSEILKRAENAIFARAISAIRPNENKKSSDGSGKKETSPTTISIVKRTENATDSKLQTFQVTVPLNESGSRSVELKSSNSGRETNRGKKSPLRTSIKNRLGVKVSDSKSSESGDSRRRPTVPLSSCIRVSSEKQATSNRSRVSDRKRSATPVGDRRLTSTTATSRRLRTSRSKSNSRHHVKRSDQRSANRGNSKSSFDRYRGRSRDRISRSKDQNRTKEVDHQSSSLNEREKSQVKISRKDSLTSEVKKRTRDSSSSSTSSSSESSKGSVKHSKRHSKHKKRSRSQSADSNSNSKRKKAKKEKKAKKKKKSRK